MAKKIVGVVRPFDRKQNFYVYEDGNKLAIATPTIDEINNTIFSFVDTYDVHQVDLVGPKQYLRGLGKKIKEAELTKYNKNELEINII